MPDKAAARPARVRRRARWRGRWWTRGGRGGWIAAVLAVSAVAGRAVDAMVQQAQLVARCREWVNGSCHFAPLHPIQFSGLDLTRQTMCKVGSRATRWATEAVSVCAGQES